MKMKKIIHGGGATRENKSDKVDYTLIPPEALTILARVYTDGGKVHGDYNRLKGDKNYMNDMKKSAMRHFINWLMGKTDEPHLFQCVWNLFSWYILYLKLNRPEELSEHTKDILAGLKRDEKNNSD